MRAIDADALMAEMHNIILEDGEDRRTFYEVIERQPTIEPEHRWIPCSERLPESDDAVLVCAKDYFECELYENLTARVCDVFPDETSTQELDFGCKHGECGNCDMESRKPYSIRMHVGWIEADNKWDGELSDSEIVIAWMPLPEPYREEGEERC